MMGVSAGKELERMWKEVMALRCSREIFVKGESAVRMASLCA